MLLGLGGCATEPVPEPPLPATGFAQFLAGLPVDPVTVSDQRLRTQATNDALLIARAYSRSDRQVYPGVKALGEYLLLEVEKFYPPFDFSEAVSHNPLFWQAALELSPQDVSFPYLTASLAVIGKDYATASRILALAQAALPLGQNMRRAYSLPEAMLGYHEMLLLKGLPVIPRLKSADACLRIAAGVRERLAKAPGSPGLMRALIELEVQRVRLLAEAGPKNEAEKMEAQKIADLLAANPEVVRIFRDKDPITAAALDATVADWMGKKTLLQKWVRWTDFSEPADAADVEKSIIACEAAGRPDLAWLDWRYLLVLRPLTPESERDRWKAWGHDLLSPAGEAQLARTAASPVMGSGMMGVLPEGPSEAWAGDEGIHPLLAIQVERGIALVDAMLGNVAPGSKQEGDLRLTRAQRLSDVGATVAARKELARAEQILGRTTGVEFVDVILLAEERRFAEIDARYAELLKKPPLDPQLKFQYAIHLYMMGRYEQSAVQYRELAATENEVYMAIMAELALRRAGGGDREALLQARQRAEPGSWQEAGLKFLLGELNAQELLDAARHGAVFDIIQHECEGYFWLAQTALASGDREAGVQWLRRCVSSGFTAFIEHRLAKEELERLVPAENEPSKDGPKRDSYGVAPA